MYSKTLFILFLAVVVIRFINPAFLLLKFMSKLFFTSRGYQPLAKPLFLEGRELEFRSVRLLEKLPSLRLWGLLFSPRNPVDGALPRYYPLGEWDLELTKGQGRLLPGMDYLFQGYHSVTL